jgi:hypothetical protein
MHRVVWNSTPLGSSGHQYSSRFEPHLISMSPVKFWGFLANGTVKYHLLPASRKDKRKTTHMTIKSYCALVRSKFGGWRQQLLRTRRCAIIQDHERCLWNAESLASLRKAGCDVVQSFPKASPDLNPIENIWKMVRDELDRTSPRELESRVAFVKRLNATVRRLNASRKHQIKALCNMRKRCEDVLKLKGCRTKW